MIDRLSARAPLGSAILTGTLIAWLTCAGCGPVVSPPVDSDKRATSAWPLIERSTEKDQDGSQARWDVIRMQGHPVGWQMWRLHHTTSGRQVWCDGHLATRLAVQRFGQRTETRMEANSRESSSGDVVQVRLIQPAETQRREIRGERHGDVVKWQQHSDSGLEREWETPVPTPCGGFLAVEWSLLRAPLIPGEVRTLTALLPLVFQPASIELRAAAYEDIRSQGKVQRALRIAQVITLPEGTQWESTAWTLPNGTIIRTETATLEQTTERTTKDEALAFENAEVAQFDLAGLATIPVAVALPAPSRIEQIRYRLRWAADHSGPFEIPHTKCQSVVADSSGDMLVTVTAPRFGARSAGRPVSPTTADLQPSRWIDFDHPAVQDLVDEMTRSRPPVQGAIGESTARFVHQHLLRKDLTTAMASASEVARSRQGDCTEHAVLLAALLRAQDVPSRIVVGLVYAPSLQAFAFHMWAEAWENDSWNPCDGTQTHGRTGATHLALLHSSWEDTDDLGPFIPVLRLLGHIQLDILEVRESAATITQPETHQ